MAEKKEKEKITTRLKKKVQAISGKKEELAPALAPSFEDSHLISPLKLFVVIVPYGQAGAIIKRLESMEAASSFIISAQGTGSKDIYDVIGLSDTKKQVILSVLKGENVPEFKRLLEERFSISRAAKGIAFSIKITSLVGVTIYKFLSNMQVVREKKKNG